jgi:hypothetical protein
MAVLHLFKMLALSLVGLDLVAITTASPIAMPAANDVSAAAKSYLAADFPIAITGKREEAKKCFWVCIHTYCTRQCIGDDEVAALKASSALIMDEADMKADTTISVTSTHAKLGNPFLYHCDWTSGMCWTDPAVLQAQAGTDKKMEEIPDIPTKVCREVCNTDESLCGLVCDVDENGDKKTDVEKAGVSSKKITCHWECYFGQCYACCVPFITGGAVEKRDTSIPPCHQRCDDDKCWIVCPRPPIE